MPAEDTLRPSEAPDMWGIDPDEIYHWTPKEGRKLIAAGEWNTAEMRWDKAPVYGAAHDGVLVVDCKALPESIAVELAAAKNRYLIAQARLMQKVASAKKAFNTDETLDRFFDKLDSIYPPELIAKVLKASIVGWKNLKSRSGKVLEFSGVWTKDSIKLKQSWQAELFKDILDETLYQGQEASFTSEPESSADLSKEA